MRSMQENSAEYYCGIRFILSLLVVLLSLISSHAEMFHDLSYKELSSRSYSLNSSFAIVSSAKELYDLKHAQEVRAIHQFIIICVLLLVMLTETRKNRDFS